MTNRELQEEAADRAKRAKQYAKKFPLLIAPSDLRFQSLDWQLEQVSKPPALVPSMHK